MSDKKIDDLEREIAFLNGRILELQEARDAAEDYAEALFSEPCANCGASDDDSAVDVWPGDEGYKGPETHCRVGSYIDLFGVERVPPGDN